MSNQAVGLLTSNFGAENILPDNILDIDTSSVKCFLCDKDFVTGDESFLLFNERIQSGSSECPLAQILTSALDVEIEESTAHSSLLCSRCNEIVLEYEKCEQKLFDLRLRIITSYSSTTLRLKDVDIVNDENETNFISEDNSADERSTLLKEVEVDKSERTEDAAEENLHMITNVFDSFEMIGESNEIHDNIKLFSVEGSLNFEDKEGIIIYEESQSGSEQGTVDESKALEMEQGSDSIEDATLASGEVIELHKDALIIEEPNELFSCSICDDSIYLDAKDFSDHMYSAHKLRVYPCDSCNNAFQRKQDLNEHVAQEHAAVAVQTIKFECNLCDRIFDSYRIFRAHKRTAHNVGTKFECQECHKKYNCKTALEEHMNVHYGLRPFECEQCPKKFASKYALHIHMKTHGERERPHRCDECGKSFLTIQNLHHHKKTHSEKLFVCKLCPKSFATQHSLDAHSVVHSGKRPFVCRTCGKAFARRAEVIDHERIHTGARPFKCDMCDMAFTQRSNLTAHKKTTHFNEKQHTCEICKRSFKRRRLLDYHTQAVHTGERPYKCETCTSSFVYPEHYKKHLRIHTGLKPFACEVCGKRFSSSDNRNAHRFVHSDKKPYECVECGAGFMRKPLLLAHMKHSKHVSDTIIVNQPQTSAVKVKTSTLTVQNDDVTTDSFEEAIAAVAEFEEESRRGTAEADEEAVAEAEAEEDEADGEHIEIGQSISLENMLPTTQTDMAENSERVESESEFVVLDGGVLIKSDMHDGRYLQFDEFDAGNHQTLSWVDLAGDKD